MHTYIHTYIHTYVHTYIHNTHRHTYTHTHTELLKMSVQNRTVFLVPGSCCLLSSKAPPSYNFSSTHSRIGDQENVMFFAFSSTNISSHLFLCSSLSHPISRSRSGLSITIRNLVAQSSKGTIIFQMPSQRAVSALNDGTTTSRRIFCGVGRIRISGCNSFFHRTCTRSYLGKTYA